MNTITLQITIKEDENGLVWSEHHLASQKDEETAAKMRAGGAWAIAQGLLIEAIKREAFADALVLMSKKDLDLTDPKSEDRVCDIAKEVLLRNITKVTMECVQYVFTMLRKQSIPENNR